MKYSSLLFVTAVTLTISHSQAVSKSVTTEKSVIAFDGHSAIGGIPNVCDLSLTTYVADRASTTSAESSPRKPKKFKKKSHAHNKKHGRRK